MTGFPRVFVRSYAHLRLILRHSFSFIMTERTWPHSDFALAPTPTPVPAPNTPTHASPFLAPIPTPTRTSVPIPTHIVTPIPTPALRQTPTATCTPAPTPTLNPTRPYISYLSGYLPHTLSPTHTLLPTPIPTPTTPPAPTSPPPLPYSGRVDSVAPGTLGARSSRPWGWGCASWPL